MARPPKGKPLTYRPIRLDDDVWKECQRLGKEHGTINEGLRAMLLMPSIMRRAVEEMKAASVNADPVHGPVGIDLHEDLWAKRPFKGPIPKPKDKK